MNFEDKISFTISSFGAFAFTTFKIDSIFPEQLRFLFCFWDIRRGVQRPLLS